MITRVIDSAESQHINRCTPPMRDWYYELRAFVFGLGHDVRVTVPASRTCTTFWRSQAFAYFNCQPKLHRIAIDIPHPGRDLPFDEEFLRPWRGQRKDRAIRILIDSVQDVERAKPYILQSYRSSD